MKRKSCQNFGRTLLLTQNKETKNITSHVQGRNKLLLFLFFFCFFFYRHECMAEACAISLQLQRKLVYIEHDNTLPVQILSYCQVLKPFFPIQWHLFALKIFHSQNKDRLMFSVPYPNPNLNLCKISSIYIYIKKNTASRI